MIIMNAGVVFRANVLRYFSLPVQNDTWVHVPQLISFIAMPAPIYDINFLGLRAKQLCAQFPTYWEVPVCDDNRGMRRLVDFGSRMM